MGKGYIYKCPNCKHELELLTGVGMTTCPDASYLKEEILAGEYGFNAKAFVGKYPYLDYRIEASKEIYKCKCGNIQNDYHIVLQGYNSSKVSNRQHCIKCGSIMKMISEPPELGDVLCPECGSYLKLDLESLLWWD